MAKNRTAIPLETAVRVMFEHDRSCCVCGSRVHLQIHHIDEDPSNHEPDNLAVLCLEHHNDTQVRGGFARKLGPADVRYHRDDWIRRVARRKEEADKIAAAREGGTKNLSDEARSDPPSPPPALDPFGLWNAAPSDSQLFAYLNSLPDTLAAARKAAQTLWETGVTADMSEGSYLVTEAMEQMWLRLSRWFPPNHFGDRPAANYVTDYLSERAKWHRALADRWGPARGGTNASLISAAGVMDDAAAMIVQTVRALVDGTEFDFLDWERRWKGAEIEALTASRQARQELDDLFAEGVRHRNKLLAPIDRYDDASDRAILRDWSDLVVQKLNEAGVALNLTSRFRTLNLFTPEHQPIAGRDPHQVKLEAIWNEKLRRLREIIDGFGDNVG